MEINTTLLREKFILLDHDRKEEPPVIAVSNRMVLPLRLGDSDYADLAVIRSHNMHGCARMAAQILQGFIRSGPVFSRAESFDFEYAWERSCSSHEIRHNPDRWIAVYHKGKEVYASGAHHAFLDVIEKCEAKNPGDYDRAREIAEDTFKKMGRNIEISYQSNIAMVLHLKQDVGRCGLIHRGAERNSTFNFVVEPAADERVSPTLCLNSCAAFLEGFQLSYQIGTTNDRMRLELVEPFSPETKKQESALHRLAELNTEISSFENRLKIKYRPERPEFSYAVAEAERQHHKTYEAEHR